MRYLGRNQHDQRLYDVEGQTVTAVNEEEWEYTCTCGTYGRKGRCRHVHEVIDARAAFEAADRQFGM